MKLVSLMRAVAFRSARSALSEQPVLRRRTFGKHGKISDV